MPINCNICNKELDAFSGGRCKICRALICKDCIASGSTEKKSGIICSRCAKEREKANKVETVKPQEQENKPQLAKINSRSIAFIIIGCFTILCIFIYIITIPYITAHNALKIIEFGPNNKLQSAKMDLANNTGSYVIEELEDMALRGKPHTAIRAIYALGAQPDPRAVLILKQLQLSPECPEYLQSVIIEALLENERLYKQPQDNQNK